MAVNYPLYTALALEPILNDPLNPATIHGAPSPRLASRRKLGPRGPRGPRERLDDDDDGDTTTKGTKLKRRGRGERLRERGQSRGGFRESFGIPALPPSAAPSSFKLRTDSCLVVVFVVGELDPRSLLYQRAAKCVRIANGQRGGRRNTGNSGPDGKRARIPPCNSLRWIRGGGEEFRRRRGREDFRERASQWTVGKTRRASKEEVPLSDRKRPFPLL